jgi:hypothetical protein
MPLFARRALPRFARDALESLVVTDAAACGEPGFEEVAQGVPESSPPDPSSRFSISSITAIGDDQMLVRAQVKLLDLFEVGGFDVHLVLTPSSDSYLVDDFLISTIGAAETE